MWNIIANMNCRTKNDNIGYHSYLKCRFNGIIFRAQSKTDVLFSTPRKKIILSS